MPYVRLLLSCVPLMVSIYLCSVLHQVMLLTRDFVKHRGSSDVAPAASHSHCILRVWTDLKSTFSQEGMTKAVYPPFWFGNSCPRALITNWSVITKPLAASKQQILLQFVYSHLTLWSPVKVILVFVSCNWQLTLSHGCSKCFKAEILNILCTTYNVNYKKSCFCCFCVAVFVWFGYSANDKKNSRKRTLDANVERKAWPYCICTHSFAYVKRSINRKLPVQHDRSAEFWQSITD